MKDVAQSQRLTLEEIEKRFDELPSLPSVVIELVQLDPASDDFASRVRQVAETDPPLAVRMLAAANSAASAPVSEITSMEAALTRLGARRVATIVTSLAVMRVFVPSTEGERNLWRHAVQVAVAARIIANACGASEQAGEAYLMGLLHDIGRFVLFEHDPVELVEVDQSNWRTPDDLVETERETIGFDHAGLGARACRHWGLPERIVQVIEQHHLKGDIEPPELSTLVRIIQLADNLSCFLLHNADFQGWAPDRQLDEVNAFLRNWEDDDMPVSDKKMLELLPYIQSASMIQLQTLGLG